MVKLKDLKSTNRERFAVSFLQFDDSDKHASFVLFV
jgi:hypothetical protein